MCDHQKCDHDKRGVDRRAMLRLAGLGLASAGLGLGGAAMPAAAKGGGTSLTPDQALAALKTGNARYVSNPQMCVLDLARKRADLAGHQAPWAVIVGCSDSRVPPELLFGGLGPGELFVARNAGNMVDETATLGTIEYGAEHLGAPLVVVLGHQSCGAVSAACDVATKGTKLTGAIGAMVAPIVPAAKAVEGKPGDFVDNAVRESAKRTAAHIVKVSPVLANLVKENKLKVVAARYGLGDGKVEYL